MEYRFFSSSGLNKPYSVIKAVTYSCGVTSNAGFLAWLSAGPKCLSFTIRTSFSSRSSIGISSPDLIEKSNVLPGAAT